MFRQVINWQCLPKHHAEIFPHHSSHETEKNDGCGNRAEQSSQSPNINCVWIWKNKPVTFFTKVQKNGDDLAILHFELVKLHKQRKMLCGEYTISSVNIRNGFRVIPVRNPQTGETLQIAGSNAIKVSAGSKLKAAAKASTPA